MNKINRISASLVIVISLIAWGCEKDNDDQDSGEEIFTADIRSMSQFFSFNTGEFVNTYDIVFSLQNMSYVVQLNSASGVQAILDSSGDFDAASIPDTSFLYDTPDYNVIGSEWMDIATYNPSDHSIQSNGNINLIRSADYEWIKFSVLSGSPTEFSIKYAVKQEDNTFGEIQFATIIYSEDSPAYYEFTSGELMEPENWDIGFITISVFAPGVGLFYTPAVHLNYDGGVRVAILKTTDFDDILSVPADINWSSDTGEQRNLGYLGPSEVLVYHPEPPYNHKVILEHPEYVYLIVTNGLFYKLHFLEYSSGVVLFEYDKLQM